LSIAALFGSVPFEDIESRGVGVVGDRGSTKLTLESRRDGGGGAFFSAALSRFSSSDRCYALAIFIYWKKILFESSEVDQLEFEILLPLPLERYALVVAVVFVLLFPPNMLKIVYEEIPMILTVYLA
jgi:hypothetical protein